MTTEPLIRPNAKSTLVASDKFGDSANGFPSSATIGADEQHALTVTVDRRTNSMIIGGTPRYTDLCQQIIDKLDGKPAQQRITHVYRLKYAQSADVVAAVQVLIGCWCVAPQQTCLTNPALISLGLMNAGLM